MIMNGEENVKNNFEQAYFNIYFDSIKPFASEIMLS